ncbi:MAG: peptidoglycan editing factor PgeF [Thiobacillus sp.]
MGTLITPDWPVPAHVKSLMTTRTGGASVAPFGSLNLAAHVQDDPLAVVENRRRLRETLPAEPIWLNQIHGTQIIQADTASGVPDADASFTRIPETVCVVMTADCLPVLFCARDGSVVAAAHAGWRGLAAGVLEATLAAMQVSPGEVIAWLGAAIGPDAFEVGPEVRDTFIASHPQSAAAFVPHSKKWLADIYALARIRLNTCGVAAVYGGGLCTYTDAARFYSYRRDGATGRMATLIWLA